MVDQVKVRQLDELEVMNEIELESVIATEPVNADNARYMLGKL